MSTVGSSCKGIRSEGCPQRRRDSRPPRIYEYIARDDAVAADRHREKLIRRWQILVQQPRLGRKRDDIAVGYRSIAEGDYVIFYEIVSKTQVRIMRVVQGQRDLGIAIKD